MEEMVRFIIYGAGAIGSLFGAYLAQTGYNAVLIGREEHAKEINRRGLKIIKPDGSFVISLPAVTSLASIEYESGDTVFLTTKSQDTQEATSLLAKYAPPDLPIFCFQNGVRNEEITSQRFSHVYGGVVLFSGTYLKPGEIAHTRVGRVGLGLYPSGIDDTARRVHGVLKAAGFQAFLHENIMAVKWSKLVTNLRMAVNALTGLSGEEALANREVREFMADITDEGVKVMLKAGIVFDDEPGKPPTAQSGSRLRAMKDSTANSRAPEEMKHRPSAWQDLALKRGKTELDLINGEVVELGKKVKIKTPLNSLLLRLVKEMAQNRIPAGRYNIADLKKMLAT
jgi:2-dehydropantoate 2-reductase